MARVHLDRAATTPLRPEAVAALEHRDGLSGNPSGGHGTARAAKTALEEAREVVATHLGAAPAEIVFTGGGTEADNLAVKGAAREARARGIGNRIVVSSIEHKAVLASADRLEREGFEVVRVDPGPDGIVDPDAIASALTDDTVLVSVMLVNNEVGTIQPLDEIAGVVRADAPRAVLHTDAVQGVPWIDVTSATSRADLVAVSAHKFGGPKGVGALVVRNDVALEPLIEGGGQEAGRRSGTSNVAGAVAMAAALDATTRTRDDDVARVGALRDRLRGGLLAVDGAFENGDPSRKIAGNLHLGFPGVEFETLLVALDRAGIDAAAGSSCSSGATEASYVLEAMGLAETRARGSVRLSLAWCTTDAEIDTALTVIPEIVDDLRTHAVAS